MVKDPICQMEFDEDDAAATATYKGRTYYFCSDECRQQFETNPGAYVAPPALD